MPDAPAPSPLDVSLPLAALRQVLDGLRDGVILADGDGRVTYANAAARRLGAPAEFDDAADTPPLARAALHGEVVTDARWRLRRPDGTDAVVEGTATPLADDAGRRVGGALVIRDVTEKARLREALRASDERTRGLELATPVGIFHVDVDANVTYVNPRIAEIWGVPQASMLGRGWTRRVHPDDLAPLLRAFTAAIAGGRDYDHEFRMVADDGSVRVLRGRSATVRDGSGEVVGAVGTVEDVTVRRRAEAALRASEARLAGIIASATDAIITTDAAHRIVLANAAAEHTFGYAVAELVGQPIDLLLPERCRATHREQVARLARAAADARAAGGPGTLARVDLAARRRDGGEFPIEASISRVVTDEGTFYTVILRDVSERRRAEAERERLLAAERAAREEAQERRREADEANAAKSRFLATTSHEIRTPINAILGYTELLEMGLAGPLTDEQSRYLARLRLSGRHLLGVVNQVLDLSKIEADKVVIRPRAARAADAAARAVALVEPQAAARGVALASACGAGEAAYLGDPERVEQVLVNLVTNAVKFTRAGGRVTVSCGAADAPAPDAAVAAEAPAGWTYVRVEDTGIGVPPERLGAIWEPFEQADAGHTRAYGGTGLGLTISRRLARLMGGDVTVRSEPGAGSTFVLWLPAAPPPDPAGAAALRERRRADTRHARGLGRAADAALAELEGVLAAYAGRLRADPETPSAWALPAAELEDHTATFLAEVAQCLTVIEAARGAPSESMRDGSAIQRVIAERHGAQRARLGWAEGELRREFTILREELAAAVRRRLAGEPDVALDQALTLIAGFLDRAERTSVEAYRAAPSER